VAMMAPTEILAKQHAITLSRFLGQHHIPVLLMTSSTRKLYENGEELSLKLSEAKERLLKGRVVAVGTHALLQAGQCPPDLALAIVDEQHRFGVHQRLSLKEKGELGGITPHQLIMTATPIPRTLAMTAYADLDVSIIDQLPAGRKPIQTTLLSNAKRQAIIERIRLSCQQGRQVYWVCTLIEDSETLTAEAATKVWQDLSQMLPEIKVGLVHGRLKPAEKESIMAEFKAGNISLLVATTVIEVGVDVPNASVMIIENAERLGLAQLHQLRGRVGRGQQESFCVLLYQKPLSAVAKKRLEIMRDNRDGFLIAEEDLKIRGPGEVLGVRQTGMLRLKVADLLRDEPLLPEVKRVSQYLVQNQPQSVLPLVLRWLQGAEQYIEA